MIAFLLQAMWSASVLLVTIAQDAEGLIHPVPLPASAATVTEAPQEQGHEGETALERARRLAGEQARPEHQELLGADGRPILPGQLPATAAPEARARWQQLLDAILTTESTKPISSFRLGFYLRHRTPDVPQSNDADLEFDFLAPGFLRAELESGRSHLRGPEGDYLIDNQEVIRLMGREGAEDIRQIDEMAAIARNFVGLTDPRTLRIAELKISEPPFEQLPTAFANQATKLAWLTLKSPDFYLYRSARGKDAPALPIYRAQLGVDSATQEVRMAVIHEDRSGTLALETAALVVLSKHLRRNGFLVPHRIELFDVDLSVQPWRFRQQPTSELVLKSKTGSLRAKLKAEDFLPPPK